MFNLSQATEEYLLKVIIAGSRGIEDYSMLLSALKLINFEITEVVCGLAVGVDLLGERWAITNNIPIKYMPAKWNVYGKKAGIVRNKEMADYADAAIVLWDTKSPGAKNMIHEMQKRMKPVYIQIPSTPLDALNGE